MKAINNFSNISAAGNNARLAAGGYVCRITSVTDNSQNQRLEIEYDIAEGEMKNYSADMLERLGWTSCRFVKSYKEKALPFFRSFIDAIDETNKTNFAADIERGFDEKKLIGKGIGIVIGEEEYRAKDGSVKTRICADSFVSANDIRSGKFTVPALKKLDQTSEENNFTVANDDGGELPF